MDNNASEHAIRSFCIGKIRIIAFWKYTSFLNKKYSAYVICGVL